MTTRQFQEFMARLAALFPQREITTATVAAYAEYLQDMDVDIARATARRLVDTCEWFPSVKQVRETAVAILRERGTLPLSADDAWQQVMLLAARWDDTSSTYGLPALAAGALRDVGGMYALANLPSAGMARLRAEFIRAYEARQRTDVDIEAVLRGGTALTGGMNDGIPLEERADRPTVPPLQLSEQARGGVHAASAGAESGGGRDHVQVQPPRLLRDSDGDDRPGGDVAEPAGHDGPGDAASPATSCAAGR